MNTGVFFFYVYTGKQGRMLSAVRQADAHQNVDWNQRGHRAASAAESTG